MNWGLLGWRFVEAEVFGGVLFILLVAALVYAACLFVTIVVVALVVDGLAPEVLGAGAANIRGMDYFSWDYTTWLNLVFVPLASLLWWAGRRTAEADGGHGSHEHR